MATSTHVVVRTSHDVVSPRQDNGSDDDDQCYNPFSPQIPCGGQCLEASEQVCCPDESTCNSPDVCIETSNHDYTCCDPDRSCPNGYSGVTVTWVASATTATAEATGSNSTDATSTPADTISSPTSYVQGDKPGIKSGCIATALAMTIPCLMALAAAMIVL